jgi:signal transduction histidine kinase
MLAMLVLAPLYGALTYARMVVRRVRALQDRRERELAQIDQRRSQFMTDIAHDLRTPLTVVKGNLQLLDSEALSDKGRQYLDVSTKKTEALKNMVDEFFELSVLESDPTPARLETIDLTAFLTEFLIDHEELIRAHSLEPEIQLQEREINVSANREMLQRVFENLISNILKYANNSFFIKLTENGTITVGNKLASGVTIDTEHIFDRTYRADKARSSGSAGLGLYIAKLLMEKQNGTITASDSAGILSFRLEFTKP